MEEHETAVKSTIVSFSQPMPTTETLGYLSRSNAAFYLGPLFAHALRDLNKYNLDNRVLIPHSVESSHPTPHFHRDAITYSYTPRIVGTETGYYKFFRTSNNVFKFHINDSKANLPHWEEARRYIEPWLAATERNNAIEYVKRPEFTGIVVASRERVADRGLNKYVTDILAYKGPLNDLGKSLSREWKLREIRKNYKASFEYQRFIEFVRSLGFEGSTEEKGYGIGFLPKDAAAGVAGDNILLVNKNFSSMVRSWAKTYNVSEEIVMAYLLAFHEPGHLAGIPGGIEGEERLEEIIKMFAEKLANEEQSGMPHNTANRRASGRGISYRQIGRIASQREADVLENYGKKGIRFSGKSIENAKYALRAEAYANGLKDEGKIEEYIATGLEEELAKEALKESEGLEAIVEKEEGREKAEQKAEEYSNKAQDKTEGEGSAEKDGDKEMAEAGTGGNQASE